MDKWNRDNQNVYTGINIQRRNRRRPGQAQEDPGAPAADRPAVPVTPDRSVYMRPQTPEEPEQPGPAEDPEEIPEPAGTEENREPDEREKTEEPVMPDEPEENGDPAEPDEPEKPEASDEPEETPEPAGPKKTDEPEMSVEPEITAQRPDSRIPPEARRMAAAPYGIAGSGVRRVGSETRQERAVRPGENRIQSLPRREKPAGRPGEAYGRPGEAAGRSQRARVHVGYAPGRMNEEMTQLVPAAETVRQPVGTRDAKAYLEKRNNPFHAENNGDRFPNRRGHWILRAAVALLVVAGLVLSGWMFIKGGKGKKPGGTGEAPQVFSFESPNTEGLVGPTDLNFSATTDKSVAGLRLLAEDGEDKLTDVKYGDNADNRLWTMKMHVETGFHGTVLLQVRREGSTEWYDTEYTAELNVTSPLGDDETEENAKPEEDDDYYNEDEENTEEPADAMTEKLPEEGQAVPAEGIQTEPEEGQSGQEPAENPEAKEETAEDDGELPSGELKTPAPTDTPAPELPDATPTPPLTVEAAPEASADLITGTTVYTSVTKKVKEYNRPAKELIHMPAADEYTNKRLGVMTFRGDNFRRNAAVGTLSAEPKQLSVMWQTEGGSSRGTSQTYYGYQWTGQPVIARWSTEVRSHSNITEAKIEKNALKEVIIAGMDGWIRFLDLADGKITRNSIRLGYPFKGTPSLHTSGYPYMTVGQFARKMKGKTGRIGLRQYNLFTQDELKLIDGLDGKYHRPLNDIGSFETSALVDRISDTLIAVGTNGMLYLQALNTSFDYKLGVMTTSPSLTVMTSKVKGRKDKSLYAVESSLAAYDKYVFYADMGGVLRCVDTNNLQPVWAVNTGDSVMAAIAMDLTTDRELNLYTANMLNNRKKGDSDIQIRRYNALNGQEIWCTDIGVHKGKKDKEDVGAKASPVIGQNALNDLVYFTVTGLSEDGRTKLGLKGNETAALIALNKDTGKAVWTFGLASRSESSPIALYDDNGNGWIVQCEQNGMMHLLDGLTGAEVSSLNLEAEIEASPAAYNNVVVIGTTGKDTSYIYGIEVILDQQEADNAREETLPEQEETPEQETNETPEEETEESEETDEEVSGGA